MPVFPDKPFRTADFSGKGGGIDFLGLRWVNLEMVGRYLIPEINNNTRDLGTFALGTWVAWKFRQLCKRQSDCTEANYQSFQEKVQVLIALQAQSPILEQVESLGPIRNPIGRMQRVKLPGILSFKHAKRNASLFDAQNYGPALSALGLIQSYKLLGADGTSIIAIPTASDDVETRRIVEMVDHALCSSGSYDRLSCLKAERFEEGDVVSLGNAGLHPGYWRKRKAGLVKEAFRKKLVPLDSQATGYRRTVTARLILETLSQGNSFTTSRMRSIWYTGMYLTGDPLECKNKEIQVQQKYWAHFMARQYQKYALETLFYCFEVGLKYKCRTIGEIISYHLSQPPCAEGLWPATFDELLGWEASAVSEPKADLTISRLWNEQVHPGHDHFEESEDDEEVAELYYASRLLARWFWRMVYRLESSKGSTLFDLGRDERMSMKWFLEWVQHRRQMPFRDFLGQVFQDLVFAQHIRVALARFDNQKQRLRFMLGDRGIEPTAGVSDIGDRDIPWMPDRLESFCGLLADVDILSENADTSFSVGSKAPTLQ